MIRVLFVCMGNICRSPAGEGILLAMAEDRGWSDRLSVDSAGTIDGHEGERPDRRMIAAARARGYELPGRARQIRDEDLEDFDLILTADPHVHASVLRRARSEEHRRKIRPMIDWLPGEDLPGVPDPYYGGPEGFERVLDLLETLCGNLLAELAARLRSGPGAGSGTGG